MILKKELHYNIRRAITTFTNVFIRSYINYPCLVDVICPLTNHLVVRWFVRGVFVINVLVLILPTTSCLWMIRISRRL